MKNYYGTQSGYIGYRQCQSMKPKDAIIDALKEDLISSQNSLIFFFLSLSFFCVFKDNALYRLSIWMEMEMNLWSSHSVSPLQVHCIHILIDVCVRLMDAFKFRSAEDKWIWRYLLLFSICIRIPVGMWYLLWLLLLVGNCALFIFVICR